MTNATNAAAEATGRISARNEETETAEGDAGGAIVTTAEMMIGGKESALNVRRGGTSNAIARGREEGGEGLTPANQTDIGEDHEEEEGGVLRAIGGIEEAHLLTGDEGGAHLRQEGHRALTTAEEGALLKAPQENFFKVNIKY